LGPFSYHSLVKRTTKSNLLFYSVFWRLAFCFKNKTKQNKTKQNRNGRLTVISLIMKNDLFRSLLRLPDDDHNFWSTSCWWRLRTSRNPVDCRPSRESNDDLQINVLSKNEWLENNLEKHNKKKRLT
jgi:hypothetical protein